MLRFIPWEPEVFFSRAAQCTMLSRFAFPYFVDPGLKIACNQVPPSGDVEEVRLKQQRSSTHKETRE